MVNLEMDSLRLNMKTKHVHTVLQTGFIPASFIFSSLV